jgi:predicted N-acetyltransferase YhbS
MSTLVFLGVSKRNMIVLRDEMTFSVLTTLISRADWRRQGAGGMLLQWGIQQAAKDGAPAYLEAVPSAVSTYERHGFEHIQDTKVDCCDWGMEGEFVLAVMRKAE